jgi:hypothetical protein
MFAWLKALFAGFQLPKPAGPPHLVQSIGPGNNPIAEAARWEGTELSILTPVAETVRLFEVPLKGHEQCLLTWRFRIKTEALKSTVYPELWCRVPGIGESFSRGLHQKVSGTNDWVSLEIPFYLKAGQSPDLLKLNLVFEGAGAVRLKDIEILATPLEPW